MTKSYANDNLEGAAYPWIPGSGRALHKGPVLWLDPLGPLEALADQLGGRVVALSGYAAGSFDPLRVGPELDEEGV